MKRLITAIVVTLTMSAVAWAAPPPDVQARKEARDAAKAQRKADHEWHKEQRKVQRDLAKHGWYDGSTWHYYDGDWRHRDDRYHAIVTYPAPRVYVRPPNYRNWTYEPGMRLPTPYYSEVYYIDHHRYGLPPPPPRHRWVRVDDDVVLVALASGLIADFVYDLFN